MIEHRNKVPESKRSRHYPLLDFVPIALTWSMIAVYLALNPIILHYHLVPFAFYVGCISAYIVGKIIVAHLVQSPKFPWNNVLVVPLSLAVVDSLGPRLGLWPSALGDSTYQIAFMFCCLGMGIGVYASFVVSRDSGCGRTEKLTT